MTDPLRRQSVNIEERPLTLVNGIVADYISVDDRGLQFGDGVFETMLMIGGRVLQLEQHLSRLTASARRLDIGPLQCEQIEAEISGLSDIVSGKGTIQGTTQGTTQGTAIIKLMLTRGCSSRGYAYPQGIEPNRILRVGAADAAHSSLLSRELLQGELCYCETPLSVNPALAGLKHLGRLDNIMARSEIDGARYLDGLMRDHRGNVIEACSGNLFAVLGGRLYTPDLAAAGIDGVMRSAIIELAQQAGIECITGNMTQDQLAEMDELFITNSIIGMKSITALAGTEYRRTGMTDRLFSMLCESFGL